MRLTRDSRLTLMAIVVACVVALAAQGRIADQRGKTFDFSKPAERVVTIAIPLFWTFMTVDGSASRLVGANPVAASQMRAGILDQVFPGARAVSTDIVRGGTFTPNIEALLALEPDAVFQWADRGDALIDVLDRVGLRAVGVKNTGHETDIEKWMHMSGVVSGREARADSIVGWLRTSNERFDKMTATVLPQDRPKVLMLTEYSKVITANGPQSYGDPMIRRAGGANAATSDGQVNIEQVLRWDPDVILLTQFEQKTPADMFADPRWQPTSAVKGKRVYKLPFGVTRWGGYGPESPLFLSWLTTLLHPGRFTLPLRAEIRDAYRTLFHYEVTDADLDRVLQMTQNGVAAHYDAFHGPSRR